MSAVKNNLFKIFHLLVAAHYVFAIVYDWVYVLPDEIKLRKYSFGGKFVYLTVLNVVSYYFFKKIKHFKKFLFQQFLQTFYFSLAFVNDLIGTNEISIKDSPLIRKIKDFMFATLAFPLALDVAILFWSMYAFDRKSVFPDEVDNFFPSWLNHILHTNVAIFIIIEMIILHRQYPQRKESLIGLSVFMFSYLIWMFVTRYFAGKWAYPIIDFLDLPSKIVFFSFTMCFPFVMFFLGKFLNGKIWNSSRIERNESKIHQAYNFNP
jgi:FAR-17a/AIG1-like protein